MTVTPRYRNGLPLRRVPVEVHSRAALSSPTTLCVKVVSRSPKTLR